MDVPHFFKENYFCKKEILKILLSHNVSGNPFKKFLNLNSMQVCETFCLNVKERSLTNGQEELIDVHGRLGRGLHKEQAGVFSICLGFLCHAAHKQIQI